MKKCKSCGIVLQSTESQQLGYVVNPAQEYCQRCYRLNYYGEMTLDLKEQILSEEVLKEVEKIPGLIIWIVDLWDLSGSFKLPINRYFSKRDIILVATKRDLLPTTLATAKIESFLNEQLLANGIEVQGICICGAHGKIGLPALKTAMKKYDQSRNYILVGNANSGKSTIFKALTQQETTISPYPGTSPVLKAVNYRQGMLYDTPGLMNYGSCLQYLTGKDLKTVLPGKSIVAKSFQIYEPQSFALGGIARLDIVKVKKGTLVFYCTDTLTIHRGKVENANQFWQQHYGELLLPIIGELAEMRTYNYAKLKDKNDLCINGLGFVTISGEISSFSVSLNKRIDVELRKGMI